MYVPQSTELYLTGSETWVIYKVIYWNTDVDVPYGVPVECADEDKDGLALNLALLEGAKSFHLTYADAVDVVAQRVYR